MKYLIHTDDDKYIVGLDLSNSEDAIEIPTEVFESHDLTCYKYIDGDFIFDEEKKQHLIELENNRMLVETLKQQLASTDYKAIKHSEGLISDEDYEVIKQERQGLRDKINELEN